MPRPVTVTLLVLLAGLVLWGMRAGWRARARRSTALVPAVWPAPAGDAALGAPRTDELEGVYVSTTRSGDWLDRVAAHGLGVRSGARVRLFDAGLWVGRSGGPDLFVPTAALVAAGTSPGMAGKVVAKDGLVVVTWRAPGADAPLLDTGLRLRRAADRPVLVEALTTTIDDASGPTGTDEQTKESA